MSYRQIFETDEYENNRDKEELFVQEQEAMSLIVMVIYSLVTVQILTLCYKLKHSKEEIWKKKLELKKVGLPNKKRSQQKHQFL